MTKIEINNGEAFIALSGDWDYEDALVAHGYDPDLVDYSVQS